MISRDVPRTSPENKIETTKNLFFSDISPKTNSLSAVIRGFKSAVTKSAYAAGYTNPQWQSRFYDRIIRNENELCAIRNYIEENPLKWEINKNEPNNTNMKIP